MTSGWSRRDALRMGGLTADVRVHLIEDQHGDAVFGGEHGFEGEHDAGQFAGRGDGPEGARRFARVGRKLELDGVEPGGGPTLGARRSQRGKIPSTFPAGWRLVPVGGGKGDV